jgi:hypothetical protein
MVIIRFDGWSIGGAGLMGSAKRSTHPTVLGLSLIDGFREALHPSYGSEDDKTRDLGRHPPIKTPNREPET